MRKKDRERRSSLLSIFRSRIIEHDVSYAKHNSNEEQEPHERCFCCFVVVACARQWAASVRLIFGQDIDIRHRVKRQQLLVVWSRLCPTLHGSCGTTNVLFVGGIRSLLGGHAAIYADLNEFKPDDHSLDLFDFSRFGWTSRNATVVAKSPHVTTYSQSCIYVYPTDCSYFDGVRLWPLSDGSAIHWT